jgi:hypothetical protein
MLNWPAFLDEVEKIAAATLTQSERNRQAVQFGALGAVSGPIVGAVGNLIQKGRPLPEGVRSVPRWLAGSMATGAIFSGAVPVIRHGMERNIQGEANARARLARQQALALKGGA